MNIIKKLLSDDPPDQIHDVKFDDSDVGRISIAQRFIISTFVGMLVQTDENVYLGATRDVLIGACRKETSQSHVTCSKIVNNGLRTWCDSRMDPNEEYESSTCQKVSYSNTNIVNTSSPWFSGVIGIFGGFIIAVIVIVALHFLLFNRKNKMMAVSKGGSTGSQ